MTTEYPLEHRRYDRPEYEPFWAVAEALGMPLRRDGRAGSAGAATRHCATPAAGAVAVRRDLLRHLRASSPAHPGHRRVRAGVGAQCAHLYGLHVSRAPWRGDLPVQGPALAKAGDGMRPS